MTEASADAAGLLAIRDAEARGLRLAVLCRTAAVALAFVWILGVSLFVGYGPADYAPAAASLLALAAFTLFGLLTLAVIGTRRDRWWVKYALYAADVLGVCALFVLLPVSREAPVPQIVAFRAYGIYYLFPFIALAVLSLSWRLVVWTTLVAVAGWWAAFGWVVSGMERRLSWDDMAVGASRDAYERVFLSIDFVGYGNRVEETGLLAVAGLTAALGVYRARRVFFAQVAAERERASERARRERVTRTFGRFVPQAVADDLIERGHLAPRRARASVLVLDVAGFTAFSQSRDPAEVTERLNRFLSRASRAVAAEGGVVVTFTGDGLLAAFGVPLPLHGAEAAAVRAAVALHGPHVREDFTVRVGVATGEVAAGSIGAEDRQAFTIYGETVNRAARLEGAAKELGVSIVLDEATAAALPPGRATPLGRIALRGVSAPVPVWTVAT